MGKTYVQTVVCALVGAMLCLAPSFAAGQVREAYRYRQQTGRNVEHFDWLLEKTDAWRLTSVGPAETHRTVLNENLVTLDWSLCNPANQTLVEARREADRLILTGKRNGRPVRKELPIDAAPWYQALSLSLRAFLASSQPAVEFWTLRPDELKPLKLRAVKKGAETLDIGGRKVETQKLEIRLVGFGAMFGHSYYWLRAGDGLLLQYRGPEGMPGIKTTTVTLEKTLPAGSAPEVAPTDSTVVRLEGTGPGE